MSLLYILLSIRRVVWLVKLHVTQCVSSVFASPSCSDLSYILSLCLCHVCQKYKHTCEVSLLTVYNTWWPIPISGAYQFDQYDDEKAKGFDIWLMRTLMGGGCRLQRTQTMKGQSGWIEIRWINLLSTSATLAFLGNNEDGKILTPQLTNCNTSGNRWIGWYPMDITPLVEGLFNCLCEMRNWIMLFVKMYKIVRFESGTLLTWR